MDRTVDVHVKNLRRKIEPAGARPTYIKTVFGVGYRFDPEPGEPGADPAG
jgi:DNA-binding response OmpR family regulator